jgi:hypothetical protein
MSVPLGAPSLVSALRRRGVQISYVPEFKNYPPHLKVSWPRSVPALDPLRLEFYQRVELVKCYLKSIHDQKVVDWPPLGSSLSNQPFYTLSGKKISSEIEQTPVGRAPIKKPKAWSINR